jgi:uncharacterized protein YpuA (DUF1002 family)
LKLNNPAKEVLLHQLALKAEKSKLNLDMGRMKSALDNFKKQFKQLYKEEKRDQQKFMEEKK